MSYIYRVRFLFGFPTQWKRSTWQNLYSFGSISPGQVLQGFSSRSLAVSTAPRLPYLSLAWPRRCCRRSTRVTIMPSQIYVELQARRTWSQRRRRILYQGCYTHVTWGRNTVAKKQGHARKDFVRAHLSKSYPRGHQIWLTTVRVAQFIGAYHSDVNITDTVAAHEKVIKQALSFQPKFGVEGGSVAVGLALSLFYFSSIPSCFGRGPNFM